jgi:hypothetical protein
VLRLRDASPKQTSEKIEFKRKLKISLKLDTFYKVLNEIYLKKKKI